jgi:nucleotide-binding universal stress UspA family protein
MQDLDSGLQEAVMKKIETVLIGTSLTAASDEVVRTGVKVARAMQARVVLAHAYSPHAAYGGAPFVPEAYMDEVLEAEMLGFRHQMESQGRRLGLSAEELAGMQLGPAPAHQMLMETAQKVNAGLVVVGAAEMPRLAKLFGSTADRVMRKATCPVLVVRRELVLPPMRVLLPVDLSFLSAEAFREGLEVLGFLSRERRPSTLPEVEALYVITELDRRLFIPEEGPEQVELHCIEELDRFLTRHASDSPFAVMPRVVSGSVEDEILLRIREWEPSLVVVGTHGRGGFERFLVGSVAARVIRDGGASMLIVPPAAARTQSGAVREAIDQEVMVG